MTFAHTVFGLSVESEIPLPELPAGEGHGEVCIHLAAPGELGPLPGGPSACLGLTRQEALLYLQRIGLFKISAGREVRVAPAEGVPEGLLRLALLGPVMGALLFQRGRLALHASAVAAAGGAVAFLGISGLGKSSLAAALCRRGCSLLADDIAALDLDGRRIHVLPGPPRIKIAPAVAACLGIEACQLSRLDFEAGDLTWFLPARSSKSSLPLKRIYVLGEGDGPGVTPLSSQEAFVELIRHAYLGSSLRPGDGFHLSQFARVVRETPCARLTRPARLEELPQLAGFVRQDLRQARRDERKGGSP